MSRKILILEDAVLDLDEHFNYLAQYNQDTALRFFDAARKIICSFS